MTLQESVLSVLAENMSQGVSVDDADDHISNWISHSKPDNEVVYNSYITRTSNNEMHIVRDYSSLILISEGN